MTDERPIRILAILAAAAVMGPLIALAEWRLSPAEALLGFVITMAAGLAVSGLRSWFLYSLWWAFLLGMMFWSAKANLAGAACGIASGAMLSGCFHFWLQVRDAAAVAKGADGSAGSTPVRATAS